VRFTSPLARGGTPAIAAKASGYLFNLCRKAKTGKWYAEIKSRGVKVKTRLHKHAWQAAADLEWQLARWCAHTGQPRSHYVSNAARLVELGRADAAGVLTEAVTVTPWDLSRWDGGGGKAAPAGERLCWARVATHARLHDTPLSRPPTAADAASAASSDASSDSKEEEGDSDSVSESEEEAAAGDGGRPRSASRVPAAPARPPPAAARPAAAGAGAGRRAPAPRTAAAAAPAPPRRRRLSRFAMSLRGLLPPVSDEVLAAAVWRLYGVSAFEPSSHSSGVGRKRRRSEVAGGVGEEREGAAGGGGGGRRRVGS
jgi:hypothetical protein